MNFLNLKRVNFFLLLVIMSLLFQACSSNKQFVVKDVMNVPQLTTQILHPKDAEKPILTQARKEQFNENYKELYFKPWTKEDLAMIKDKVFGLFNKYLKNPGYGANKRKYSFQWVQGLLENANLSTYPNNLQKAITINNTDLRLLPTDKPRYSSFGEMGQSYPFDSLQNSRVYVNTPILITQISKDREWVFAEVPFAAGWIHIEDIAFVSDQFANDWMSKEFIVILSENVPLYDENRNFLVRTSIGAQFPIEMDILKGTYKIYLADAYKESRNAKIRYIDISQQDMRVGYLDTTPQSAAVLAEKFTGQAYGWGGLLGYRDCSAMLQDYFSAFGIWVPRNSSDQANYKGGLKDLSSLKPKKKKEYIIKKGIPFFTIIWMEGHVMLYVGHKDGEPLVLHNIWGLRIKSPLRKKYINIIGQTVITTLEPGKEHGGLQTNILEKIKGMRIVTLEEFEEESVVFEDYFYEQGAAGQQEQVLEVQSEIQVQEDSENQTEQVVEETVKAQAVVI